MAAARIKIYKRETEVVDGRQIEREPELLQKCWCEIKMLYGKELYEAIEKRLENTIVFEVRYCKAIKTLQKNLKKCFIEYDSEKYEVYAIDFIRNEKQYVQLKASQAC